MNRSRRIASRSSQLTELPSRPEPPARDRPKAGGVLALLLVTAAVQSACGGEAGDGQEQPVAGAPAAQAPSGTPQATPRGGLTPVPGVTPSVPGDTPSVSGDPAPAQGPSTLSPTGSESVTPVAPVPAGTAPVAPVAAPTDPSLDPATFAPAPGAFRRLTRSAFQNSLRDLLGGPVEIGETEPDSWAVGGLPTVSAAEVAISPRGVELYQSVVEQVVDEVFADAQRRDAVLGCQPTSSTDSACFEAFVSGFGRRAFRQALTTAQLERYTALVTDAAALLADPYGGMKAGMIAFLTSPNFLYRLEGGEPAAASEYWQYTSHETASRLSYFLTNSTPDPELLDAAEQNALQTVEQLRAHAERLLDSDRGRESVGNFAAELFQLPLIESRAKDPVLFPEYTQALQAGLSGEVPAMLQSIVFDRRASALELFTTRSTFVNDELAALYGLPAAANPSDGALRSAELPEDGMRAGLLGTAGILSLFANQKEGSPTLRGKFVRQAILCQEIPAPPANVSTVLPDPPPGVVYTKREKLELHMADPNCATCHALLDPIGLTLENFDAIGKFRQTEDGKDIDVSGDVSGTPFNGPVELGRLLADMPETAACLATHMYRYGTGHVETNAERSTVLRDLISSFEANGHDLRNLMLEIVATDGFRLVAPPTP